LDSIVTYDTSLRTATSNFLEINDTGYRNSFGNSSCISLFVKREVLKRNLTAKVFFLRQRVN
jgi:hypothetical protein